MQITHRDLDLVAIGETLIDFISFEIADSLQSATTFRRYQGGSPANLCVNVAKLGGRPAVISKVGVGAFGQFIKSELEQKGVITDFLRMDPQCHTSVVFITRTAGTPDFEAFRSGDYRLTPDEVPEEAIAEAKVIHTTAWPLSREPSRSAVRKAFELAQSQGKIVSLDPNYSPKFWPDREEAKRVLAEMFRYVTITKPSRDDAGRIFGTGLEPEQYIKMFQDLGPRTVIFTMGKDGMLISHDGKITHVPAHPVNVVDATGAGDCYWAGFLMALLDGHPPVQCALFAREIVEMKLTTIGPLPSNIDRSEIYARLAPARAAFQASGIQRNR
jgi:sugar/nucleoside kinase (ribokinase family)